MFNESRATASFYCALLAALALAFGSQARLTPRLTPDLHREEHRRTAETQRDLYTRLGLTAEQFTLATGYAGLALAAGVLLRGTRRLAALLALLYLGAGAYGRYSTGKPMGAPLAVIVLLVGALV